MISVVVPWTPGCPHRERAWAWARAKYETLGYEVVTGSCPPGLFNRAAAILDGAARATGDVLVIPDADVWCDPTEAIRGAETHGWGRPHRLIHRLSQASTEAVLNGADWRGLNLSDDNPQDRRPYKGNDTGTMLTIRRDVLEQVPPDRRFVGWGGEDEAWGMALRKLAGQPWRGRDDLVHLWHPPQPRLNRSVGSEESRALVRKYRNARTVAVMRALVDESREVAWAD